MKFNWGHGIALTLIAFATLMLGFLYNSFFKDHQLVTDNYYEEELKFQEQLDQTQNARKDKKQANLVAQGDNYVLTMNIEDTALSGGEIEFFRPSDQKLDFTVPIQLNSKAKQNIPSNLFQRGNYTMKVSWKLNDVEYYLEKNIFIQ
tara:strand:+ start:493 stop:933 length:441 start_codon:yes stop_codon:yes gene_type:complete